MKYSATSSVYVGNSTDNLIIGNEIDSDGSNSTNFKGYISDFNIVKGVGLSTPFTESRPIVLPESVICLRAEDSLNRLTDYSPKARNPIYASNTLDWRGSTPW